MTIDPQRFAYVPPPGLRAPEPRHPVAIIGAGPVGLTLAIDLATHGIACVVLDDNDVVSVGSRAICWSKRTLEIFNRLGVADGMAERGVTWQTGRQFHGDIELLALDLLPESGHKYPAFINLQQYHVETALIDRARAFPDLIDLRFRNRVVAHDDHAYHVALTIETPDGPYGLEAAWLVACDGARSPTRNRMGLSLDGETFDETFLIIDVEMPQSPFGSEGPPERWFWFEPPFHDGQSALLHKQPDDIYRIDLQLGPDADPETEARPDRVHPRVRAIVGDLPYRLDWVSVYRFRCARLEKFVHHRVIFAGDSAHVVSPFGARGGNGGIQDADNLGWKLAAVLQGDAPVTLIDSYDFERGQACDENIRNAARSTNFMTPKSSMDALFRAEVLRLARRHPFARGLVNSGRLSRPAQLADSPLNGCAAGNLPPGAPLSDLPLVPTGATGSGTVWLIDVLPAGFCLLHIGAAPIEALCDLPRIGIGHKGDYPTFTDNGGYAARRYGRDVTYLIRPDGHVCAGFASPDAASVAAALTRAKGAT